MILIYTSTFFYFFNMFFLNLVFNKKSLIKKYFKITNILKIVKNSQDILHTKIKFNKD